MFVSVKEENQELEIRKIVTAEEKEILIRALNGIQGLHFTPITLVTKGIEDYYFICKVKVMRGSLQMKIAKVHIKIEKDDEPQLLSIEELS
jgi:cell fate regulator YaaT (PSP1 superfamily)